MKKILNHFKKNDPIIYSYFLKIGKLEPIKKDKPDNYFCRLCKEIICQQLSDKSGDAIFSRFKKIFSNELVQPLNILSLPNQKLRGVGMSHAKARYLKHLAEEIVHGDLPIFHLNSMTDQEIISKLTKVKGIGPWTAEMFLMFTLGRDDVFSFGDLGLKKAVIKIYGFKKDPTRKQIEKIISSWSPYKTYASRILWASLEL